MYRKQRNPPNKQSSSTPHKSSKDKHTESNCYSITIRTGNGFNLGSEAVSLILDKIKSGAKYWCLVQEMIEEKGHLQGGVFYDSLKRQDHIRRDLLPLVERLFRDNEIFYTGIDVICIKKVESVKKHALEIRAHNDWDKLVRYCVKGLYEYDDDKTGRLLSYHNYIPQSDIEQYAKSISTTYIITERHFSVIDRIERNKHLPFCEKCKFRVSSCKCV